MKKEKKKNEILAKNANVTKKHSSQALVSSIILLSRSLASSGPFPRNERHMMVQVRLCWGWPAACRWSSVASGWMWCSCVAFSFGSNDRRRHRWLHLVYHMVPVEKCAHLFLQYSMIEFHPKVRKLVAHVEGAAPCSGRRVVWRDCLHVVTALDHQCFIIWQILEPFPVVFSICHIDLLTWWDVPSCYQPDLVTITYEFRVP